MAETIKVMRIVSGVQPTGEIHLGNYLGALRYWARLQTEAQCLYLVADLHALTVAQDPGELRQRVLATAALLIAIGIDPQRSALFVQSHVSEHAELAWVLDCFTTVGELQRMTQFKEKTSHRESAAVTAGLFAYPVLQAADILLYQADRVPVGHDQKQHLELTRDLAQRFNSRFGATFKLPEPLIAPVGARIMDLQDPLKKMSKSSQSPRGTIRLTDSPDIIRARIRAAVTDSGRDVTASADKPALRNLLTIYSIVAGTSVTDAQEAFAGRGYAEFKRALADVVVEFLRPIRERYEQTLSDPESVALMLRNGADKARVIAVRTLATVYDRLGFLPR